MTNIVVDDHPLLEAGAFVTEFAEPLGQVESAAIGASPLATNDEVKRAIRDLLRHGGFKPSGRSKPSSEYLIKASADGPLRAINAAVDACNAVSLASGLPISVVDLDALDEPLRIAIAEPGACYVFNPSGQQIDVSGLVCLFDRHGPCANAVKDAQRTKTSETTRRTLSIVWGTKALPTRTEIAMRWYREILASIGATTAVCSFA